MLYVIIYFLYLKVQMLPGSKDEKDVEQHGFRFFFLLHFPGNFYITLPAKKVLQHDVTIRIWLTASMFVQLCSVHVGTTYQVSIVFSLYMHTTISYILQPAWCSKTPCVTVPLFWDQHGHLLTGRWQRTPLPPHRQPTPSHT